MNTDVSYIHTINTKKKFNIPRQKKTCKLDIVCHFATETAPSCPEICNCAPICTDLHRFVPKLHHFAPIYNENSPLVQNYNET